ncbi:hypothetical protein Bbelb_064010 [Branchiostoma belcheri]|nr:hypothetical protein Bbelb_064010 [Branchiostoma belcheri]
MRTLGPPPIKKLSPFTSDLTTRRKDKAARVPVYVKRKNRHRKQFPVPHTPVKFAVSWSRPWISGLRVYGPGYFLTLPDSCSPCTCTEIYARTLGVCWGAANNKGLSESSEKKERKATAVTQKRARLEANRQTAHPGSDLKARAPTTQAGPAALPPGVHPAPSTPLRPDCDHNRHQHHAIPQTDMGQFVLPG